MVARGCDMYTQLMNGNLIVTLSFPFVSLFHSPPPPSLVLSLLGLDTFVPTGIHSLFCGRAIWTSGQLQYTLFSPYK